MSCNLYLEKPTGLKQKSRFIRWHQTKRETLLARSCRGMVMPRTITWLYGPYHRHGKTACADLCHLPKDYSTKTLAQVRTKKGIKLSKPRTTLRNNSKAVVSCRKCVKEHKALQWHFWQQKIKYVSETTLTLCSKKHSKILNLSYLAKML